jgi:hypothetical protein
MTVPAEDTPSIESIDVFARQQYRRARSAGTDFVDLAIALRNLHTAIRHLYAEAQDPDSPLHQPHPATCENRDSAYTRLLRALVEDSDFALKQVNTVIERHGDNPAVGRDIGSGLARANSGPAERRRRVDLIRGDIISQTMKIDLFLDTVRLHNPAKARRTHEHSDDHRPEMIKDKLDAIANRLFQERKGQSPIDVDEDALWRRFIAELEREGFSPEVLRENAVGIGILQCPSSSCLENMVPPVALS